MLPSIRPQTGPDDADPFTTVPFTAHSIIPANSDATVVSSTGSPLLDSFAHSTVAERTTTVLPNELTEPHLSPSPKQNAETTTKAATDKSVNLATAEDSNDNRPPASQLPPRRLANRRSSDQRLSSATIAKNRLLALQQAR
ncbi:MAG: hypothetical protein WBC73_02230 [Phormidesmis sp.]